MEEVITTVSSPTSAKVPELVAVFDSLTVTVGLFAATVGATLLTTNAKVVVLVAPSLSVAVIVTVCDSSGPSLVS